MSLPQVQRVCRFLTEPLPEGVGLKIPRRWDVGGQFTLITLFEAYYGLALLGEKQAALREPSAILDQHRQELAPDAREEFHRQLEWARKW